MSWDGSNAEKWKISGFEGLAFKCEHPLFEGYAAGGGEAAHFAISSEYAMAGDNKGQRVFGQGIADGAACGGSARLFS